MYQAAINQQFGAIEATYIERNQGLYVVMHLLQSVFKTSDMKQAELVKSQLISGEITLDMVKAAA